MKCPRNGVNSTIVPSRRPPSVEAKLGVQGIDETLKGLVELFGAESIQSFPAGLDAEADARAKPHFEAALFQAARKTLKETCSSFWSMILARDQGLRGPVR
jgi:hypothetical protein